ncbi:rod shape-determining protein RodA [Virgibacillus sp. NKC19-16]|uniref:FtsW/RodA/SpoVE family cell cycle protein n=1 Tax=Virgibacillus salidurans TaxID=2831673 RepID=UPI001F1D13FB|nr:FtsW/RodA/SpoVE family cell cycle protein [Virgibacillus sp. NKC19-16]UJL47117.1 rod shape-determining protein RodA [Virgibacillus sp. NKC19-16]
MSKKQSYYIQSDFIFLFILFVCTSLLALYNAQQLEQNEGSNFVLLQAIWFSIGACVVAAIQFIDMDQLYKASIFIYGFGVLVLAVLLVSPESIAQPVNGAKSWFQLFGVSMQPGEFAKISTIIFLAATISRHKTKFEANTLKTDSYLLLKLITITVIPVFLIMQQPDFGTAMVYLFIVGIIIILSGIDWKIITALIVGSLTILAAVFTLVIQFPEAAGELGIERYQVDRIMTWFDPTQPSSDATWHFDRAHMALGSGSLFGKGLGNLEVPYPEAHTDFIFSVIGESFGFIGSAVVIFLYFMLLYKLVTLGLNTFRHSPFAAYLCFGYFSLILIHVFQNIGMTVGIMPVTGIPLLLISYGGSSVLSTMIGYGIVYRVAVEHTIQSDYLFK